MVVLPALGMEAYLCLELDLVRSFGHGVFPSPKANPVWHRWNTYYEQMKTPNYNARTEQVTSWVRFYVRALNISEWNWRKHKTITHDWNKLPRSSGFVFRPSCNPASALDHFRTPRGVIGVLVRSDNGRRLSIDGEQNQNLPGRLVAPPGGFFVGASKQCSPNFI